MKLIIVKLFRKDSERRVKSLSRRFLKIVLRRNHREYHSNRGSVQVKISIRISEKQDNVNVMLRRMKKPKLLVFLPARYLLKAAAKEVNRGQVLPRSLYINSKALKEIIFLHNIKRLHQVRRAHKRSQHKRPNSLNLKLNAQHKRHLERMSLTSIRKANLKSWLNSA